MTINPINITNMKKLLLLPLLLAAMNLFADMPEVY